jgi:hypothetical protein
MFCLVVLEMFLFLSIIELVFGCYILMEADTLIHGHLGEADSSLTLRLAGVCHFKKNAFIPLDISDDKLHLFDKETGARLGR